MQQNSLELKRTRQRHLCEAIGTALEWFDFSVYAALATIIGAQFFGSEDPVHSFLSAVAVFGVGFLSVTWWRSYETGPETRRIIQNVCR